MSEQTVTLAQFLAFWKNLRRTGLLFDLFYVDEHGDRYFAEFVGGVFQATLPVTPKSQAILDDSYRGAAPVKLSVPDRGIELVLYSPDFPAHEVIQSILH